MRESRAISLKRGRRVLISSYRSSGWTGLKLISPARGRVKLLQSRKPSKPINERNPMPTTSDLLQTKIGIQY